MDTDMVIMGRISFSANFSNRCMINIYIRVYDDDI